jgi:hypothetical protein
MPTYLPLPGPPEVIEPGSRKGAETAEPSTQNPEPSLLFNPEQVKGLRAFYLECHQTTAELKACNEDKADFLTKQTNLQKELKLTIEQKDSAVKAMRGGGVWQRFKRNAKWFGLGLAVGGGAVAASR